MKTMKELKSIKIVPYTIMNAALNAVWGFIFAIILLIFGGAFASLLSGTELAPLSGVILGISVAGLVVFPVGSFLLSIMPSFLQALLYNLLVPKLGGIKIELEEMTEVTRAEVVPFALILAGITAVFQLIMQLVIAPLQAVLIELIGGIGTLALAATNATTGQLPEIGGAGALGAILNIIISPLLTFIFVFIGAAIAALLYNLLAPKVGGIKVELAQMTDNFFGVENINPVAIGLITGAIAAVLGLILGIIFLILLAALGSIEAGILILLTYIIGGFILVFIAYALTAVIYNILAPKIGSFKIQLE